MKSGKETSITAWVTLYVLMVVSSLWLLLFNKCANLEIGQNRALKGCSNYAARSAGCFMRCFMDLKRCDYVTSFVFRFWLEVRYSIYRLRSN